MVYLFLFLTIYFLREEREKTLVNKTVWFTLPDIDLKWDFLGGIGIFKSYERCRNNSGQRMHVVSLFFLLKEFFFIEISIKFYLWYVDCRVIDMFIIVLYFNKITNMYIQGDTPPPQKKEVNIGEEKNSWY